MSATDNLKKKLKIQVHKYLLILLFFILLILFVPFLINLLYKLPAPVSLLRTEWQAADALSYYGAILTFLGTSALSILALMQNKTINELNLQHTRLLEKMEKDKYAPVILVKYVSGGVLASNLTIALVNISENIAKEIIISECEIIDGNDITWQASKPLKIEYISAHQNVEFTLNNTALPQRTSHIQFTISYQDLFSEVYTYRTNGSFLEQNDNLIFTTKRERGNDDAEKTKCRR